MKFSGKRLWPFLGLGLALVTTLLYSSCGDDEFNLFRDASRSSALKNEDARIEEAKVKIDEGDYQAAVNLMSPLVEDPDSDSNDARLLLAAAKLGAADFGVWSLISKILESTSAASQQQGGIDAVFDSFSDTLLGTGEARAAKVTALLEAITLLRAAPAPNEKKVQNTNCLFVGLLAVPTVADATASLNATLTSLQQIRDQATSGGAQCPNISLLNDATAQVQSVAQSFALILDAASSCSFLDLQEAQNLMNAVQEQLNLMLTNADKGCASLPACPAALPNCQSLFPTCVQQSLIGATNATAGDGRISMCELVLHCTDPKSCFR